MTLPAMTAHHHIGASCSRPYPMSAARSGYRLEPPRWQHHLWVFTATAPDGREAARVTLTPCRGGRMEVFDLFVHRPHRGHQLASRLLNSVAAKARSVGGTHLWLEAYPDQGEDVAPERLFALYERHGFSVSKRHGPDRQEMVAPL